MVTNTVPRTTRVLTGTVVRYNNHVASSRGATHEIVSVYNGGTRWQQSKAANDQSAQ